MKSILSGFVMVVAFLVTRIEPAIAQTPRTFVEHVKEAESFFKQQKFAEALAAIQEAGKLEPQNYRAPALAATIFVQGGQLDKAKQSINEALRLVPLGGKAKLEKLANAIDEEIAKQAAAAKTASVKNSGSESGALNRWQRVTFPLWPDGAPGALGNAANDIPTLTVFLPDATKATGAAVVICPGGGYGALADNEGSQYARWFNELGIAGFVLKYRLGSAGYRHPAMLNDAARALRLVRARAGEWKVNPSKIGIIGSSAGGHLASTLLTHWDAGDTDSADAAERQSSRPDAVILCYPVITMTDPFAHKGSRANLLGANPSPDLVKELSAELQVKKNSPPCFIWSTKEDKTVSPENSLQLAAALRRAGGRVDLHIYEDGQHGIGLGNRTFDKERFHQWTKDCESWLSELQFSHETSMAQLAKTFDDHIRQAKTYFEEKKFGKAFEAIDEAEKLEPNNYQAAALAATILLEIRAFAIAKETITRALRLAPPADRAQIDQLAKAIDQAMSQAASKNVIVVASPEERKRGAQTDTNQNLLGNSPRMSSVPEKTIQQTLTITSETPGPHPMNMKYLQEAACIECKALTVGPNGTALTTITLAAHRGEPATAYPNGICKRGAPLRHLMLRVASAHPEYKWMGAWIQPGDNPPVHFYENGQVAYAKTSRSWLDLKPGRIALPADTLVQLDSNGQVIQAWLPTGKELFPGMTDKVPLPGRD